MKGRRPKAMSPQNASELNEIPPAHLDQHGARVWRETIQILRDEGRPLLAMHREILDGLCEVCSDVITCGEIIARDGHLIGGGREGSKRHPATSIRAQALTIKRAYLAEIGLTPTSAARLPALPTNDESNEFHPDNI